jgi:hypothetical protein
MSSDLAQIKLLLWAILSLQLLFVIGNVLCRIVGCGETKGTDYNDLWLRGKIQDILTITAKRLDTHPRDVDALYFRSKALIASGLTQTARETIAQLIDAQPTLANVANDWLSALDAKADDER